jgi:GAF domain-containing protein
MATEDDSLKDPARLAALRATGLLDTPPEAAFDRLARVAAKVLDVPVALVSLVDEDRQFFKSAEGPGADRARAVRQTPLSHSFCKHAVASGRPLVVEDAREHPLVRDNPAIAELGVVSYLGVPLVVGGEQAIGTLCVVDSKPRSWTPDQIETLGTLADAVLSAVEARAGAAAGTAAADRPPDPPAAARPDRGAHPALFAADRLADAVSAHLRRLDEYDASLRARRPDEAALRDEDALRAAIGEAAGRALAAARAVPAAESGPGGPDPRLEAGATLARAVLAHDAAVRARSELGDRFQRQAARLDEVEAAAAAALAAEQDLRLALRVYGLRTE